MSEAIAPPVQNDLDQAIEVAEGLLLDLPQLDQALTHRFAPGIYWRELAVPKGAFIIGHRHKTRHFNILLKGRLRVLIGGRVRELSAPYVVVSEPGERKAALVLEDVIWVNLHPTDETDLKKIEETFIEKSPTFLEHELEVEMESLRNAPDLIELEAAS